MTMTITDKDRLDFIETNFCNIYSNKPINRFHCCNAGNDCAHYTFGEGISLRDSIDNAIKESKNL
jgi:hypothetical protein